MKLDSRATDSSGAVPFHRLVLAKTLLVCPLLNWRHESIQHSDNRFVVLPAAFVFDAKAHWPAISLPVRAGQKSGVPH